MKVGRCHPREQDVTLNTCLPQCDRTFGRHDGKARDGIVI